MMAAHTGEELAGIRVLIVENDGDLRTLLTIIFRRCGALDVLAADSARRALELLDETCPDILVSDIGMPGEDG